MRTKSPLHTQCLEKRAERRVGIRQEKPRGSGLTGCLKVPVRSKQLAGFRQKATSCTRT